MKVLSDIVQLFLGLMVVVLMVVFLVALAFWPIILGGWWMLLMLVTIPLTCSVGFVGGEWLDDRYQ